MEKLSNQEMFDTAVKGIASQGWKRAILPAERAREFNGCAYRDGVGGKCAIGWNIPDESYNERIEGSLASGKLVQEAVGREYDTKFATELQSAHDTSQTKLKMVDSLRSFARNWDLKIPPELENANV